MNQEEALKQAEQAAVDLAAELATMHATMVNLIAKLRDTRLSRAQSKLLNGALLEVHRSQAAFFEKYGDQIGGAAPERN